ncbi:hypothetical protein KKF84_11370, partial [Myxococcota bacterium]|nr:hypothetical protein [Myxococcota bacterium]MBU1535911.1 hypothetical protein [Myxococcota bacterium]
MGYPIGIVLLSVMILSCSSSGRTAGQTGKSTVPRQPKASSGKLKPGTSTADQGAKTPPQSAGAPKVLPAAPSKVPPKGNTVPVVKPVKNATGFNSLAPLTDGEKAQFRGAIRSERLHHVAKHFYSTNEKRH